MTPLSSPTNSQRDGSADHSPASQPPTDRPERSRNAKAQARHRAKRKAYIEQLEQTVTKLQSVHALSPDQVAAIPPPLMRIRELEQENELLHREVEELRRQLEIKNAQLRPEFRRDTYTPLPPDDRHFDREPKRRRTADASGVYMTSSNHSPPPPPLSIPSITGQYASQSPSHNSGYATYSSRPLNNYSYGVPGYPVPPETPTSSATSSPSFSPSDYAPSSLSHSHQRSLSSPYGHPVLPPFSHTTSQYELVKLEDDQYTHPNLHTTNSTSHYPSAVHANHGTQQSAIAHWQYSSDR